MLHKSFKPAKCKTALKLAASRIKLLKNKREAQLKQLKREVAKLLEAGQDRTARIRVEHVVREEKTMAAYELLEIYCELIAARLSIIESQKNCPIDLKEAVSSVIFASPRCGDIPELMDIKKHFTSKYGKEFISAAVELRPDCGVSRMLVEKLSAKAPDGQTKIKILSTIAKDHDIKWDPNSSEEQDPRLPEDLLNGPNTFEKASKIYVEPSAHGFPNPSEKGPPKVQVPPEHEVKHDVSEDSYEHNASSSYPSQSFDPADLGTRKVTTSGTFRPEGRPSGSGTGNVGSRHSSGDDSAFPLGRQNRNMEFKDATAAAQAAAESAELASMAARAAVELSSGGRVTRQYSTEPQKSSVYGLSNEESQRYGGSKLHGEHLAQYQVTNASPGRNSPMHYEKIDRTEQDILAGAAERLYVEDHKKTGKSSFSSSKSTTASVDNNPLVNTSQSTDTYPQKNSFEQESSDSLRGFSMKKQPSNNEVEFVNELNDGMKSQNIEYIGDVRIRKQSSTASSHSHSSTLSDDHIDMLSLSHQNLGTNAGQEPFVVNEGCINSNNEKATSYENTTLVFDQSGSDDDYKFDLEHEFKGEESSFFSSSSGITAPVSLFGNTDPWNPRRSIDDSLRKSIFQSASSSEQHSSDIFSESLTSSTVPSQPDGLLHVTFDDSDGQSSDGEEELEKPELVGSVEPSKKPYEQNVYSRNSELNQSPGHGLSSFAEKENEASNRKAWSPPSSDDLDPMEVRLETKKSEEIRVVYDENLGYGDLPSPKIKSSEFDFSIDDKKHSPASPDTSKDNELLKESSLGSGGELSFGKLTGGLRNKGIRRPPYIRSPSGNSSPFKQASGDTSSKIDQSFVSVIVGTSSSPDAHSRKVNLKQSKPSSGALVSSSDSDNDDFMELSSAEKLTHNSSHQEEHHQKIGIEENKNPRSRFSNTYFDADSSDSEEELPKQASTSNARPITAFSRRTKAASSSMSRSSLKPTDTSESSLTPDSEMERKSSLRSSYANEAQQKRLSQTKSPGHLGSPKQRWSAEQATSKPMPESKKSLNQESLKLSTRKQAWSSNLGSSEQQRRSAEQATSKPMPESKKSLNEESLKLSTRKQAWSSNLGSSEQQRRSAEEATSYPKPESKRSLNEESLKSSTRKQVWSDNSESSEQLSSPDQATSKPMPEFKRSLNEGSLKSSTRAHSSGVLPKMSTSGSSGISNTESSSVVTPSTEKASHVHPKLPDYDSFAAHFQSLRQSR